MYRIALTGEDAGKWFDRDAAIAFAEDTRWNGNNHISRATGSQWEHETLYYTKGGRWVLHHASQWQGSGESYREIDLADAVSWMIGNDCVGSDEWNKLPDAVRAEANNEDDSREV